MVPQINSISGSVLIISTNVSALYQRIARYIKVPKDFYTLSEIISIFAIVA